MIPLDEMRDVKDFEGMDQKMLEEVAAIGEVVSAPKGTYLFQEGDRAEYYYILRKGKVALEFRQAEGLVNTETVGPGMGVGCSSLAGLPQYNAHGRCEEASRFLHWRQSRLQQLFNEDSRLGYLLIKASAKKLSKRIQETS